MTRTEEACVRPVLERIGIPLERRDMASEPWFGWDGRALNLEVPISDAVHEAAHWILASPRRRRLDDFGLERGDFGKASVRRRSESEESAASILGILMERHLGLRWQDTFRFHNWHRNGWRNVADAIYMLRARGLVRGLTPTCFLEGR